MRKHSSFTLAPSILATGLSLILSGCGGEEEASTASTDGSNAVASQMAAPAMGGAPGNGGGGGMPQGEMGGGGGGSQEHGGGGGGAAAVGDTNRGMGGSMASALPPGMEDMGGGGMNDYASGEAMNGYDAGEGMGEYAGGGGGYPGGGYPGGGYTGGSQMAGGMSGQRGPAEDYSTWTQEKFLEAVRNRDRRILTAIPTQSSAKVGDPEFAGLMTDVLAEMSGSGPAGGGGAPGFPPGYEPGGAKRGGGPLTPPGGAFFDGRHRMFKRSYVVPVDSLDVMMGQAILTYLPQAAQGTRGAADRLVQQSEHGGGTSALSAPGAVPPGMSEHDASPGTGTSGQMQPEMQRQNQNQNRNRPPQSNQPNQPAQSAYNPIQPGLTEIELVQAVVSALVQNNTLPAWQSLKAIVDGSLPTTLTSDENIQVVLTDTFSAQDLNADMAEQILNAGINGVLNAPADHVASLEVMAVLSSEPMNYFFGFSQNDGPNQAPSGMNGQPGAPGMGAPGMGAPGMGAPGMGEPGMGEPGFPGQPSGMGGQQGGGGRPPLMTGGMGGPQGNDRRPPLMAGGMGGDGEFGMEGDYGAGTSGFPGAGNSGFVSGTATGVKMLNVSLAGQFPAAKALWSKSTTERLAQLLPSNSGNELVKLAASIPNDNVRHALFEVMQASYENGSNDTFGSLTTSMLEPGMLNVLKSLPRIRPARPGAAPDPKMASKETWVEATKMTVLSLRERLRVAATNPALAYSGAPKVRLHREAVVQQSIAIVLPSDITEPLGDSAPSPTKVYYVKTSVTPQNAGQQNTLIAHYEKNSKGFKRADPVSGVMWFDGVARNSDGTRQTIDILIQQEGGSAGNQGFRGMGGQSPGMSMGGGAGMSLGGPGMEMGEGGGGGGGGVTGGSYSIEIIVVVTRDPVDAVTVAAAN